MRGGGVKVLAIFNKVHNPYLKKLLNYNFFCDVHNYAVGNYTIDLGDNHNLPNYKKNYPLYDSLFDGISQFILDNKEQWFIDIGANVGDTLFAVLDKAKTNILAIEPTKDFYSLLEKNVKLIKWQSERKILLENSYISLNEKLYYKSDVHNGTATMIESDGSAVDTIRLDHLLKKYNIKVDEIAFIKCDTDGYDAECIMSCGNQLRESNACIYWENYLLPDLSNYNVYKEFYDYLNEMGYEDFYIFDNFGNYLCRGSKETICSINDYISRMLTKWSADTFYYVDILTYKREKVNNVNKMMEYYFRRIVL